MPMTAAKIQKNNNKSRTIKIIFISLPHDLKLYQSFNQNMMIMKQRKINLMYLLLIAVFVLSSCAKSSKNAKFIPADAAVVSLDVKQMFEKSKMGDNEEAKKKLLETMEGNAKSQEAKDLIKKIVEDPAKAGVDLREPIYIFGNSEGKVGVIGTILDKDDFAQLLNALAKEGALRL